MPKDRDDTPDKGAEPIKKVPKRKVIYIEIDDEVTSVYDRLQSIPAKEVYIVVPKRSALLQSVVNLRILRRKADDLGKTIALITNDQNGIHLAQQAKIPVFTRLAETQKEGKQKITTSVPVPTTTLKTPLSAVSNEVENTAPRRLIAKKLSIFDVLKTLRGTHQIIKDSFFTKKKFITMPTRLKNKTAKVPKPAFSLITPNRKALFTLVVSSIVVLLAISYVALPSATITITPRANVIEQSVNITLADSAKNAAELSTHPARMIGTNPITKTVSVTMTYNATGTNFRGTNATGTVTIYNESGNEWPLLSQTRLQTADGLVFRIGQAVTVPAASGGTPGQLQVNITADETDAFGLVIGERGNIEPTQFFFPGIKNSANQKLLYARSEQTFTGGTTVATKKVTTEDIESAKTTVVARLNESIEQDLTSYVTQQNETNNTTLALLTTGSSGLEGLKVGTPTITVDETLVDQEHDSFEISAEVEVEGIVYNREELINILKDELKTHKSPEKKLVKIQEDFMTYRIFESDAAAGKIKITATIKGIEVYDLNPDEENGARIIKKIKEHIAGRPIDEVKNYIQNLPEVNKVSISSWPVWAPTVPSVIENITISILENSDVEAPETLETTTVTEE